MKKNIYVKPETTVVLIETEAMMAASGPESTSVTFDFNGNNSIGSGQSVDSKGHGSNLWDFDDDD